MKDTFSKKPPTAAPGCQQSWLVVRDQVHYFVEPLSDEWVQAVMVAMDAKPLITRPPCALWIHSESIAPGLVKTTRALAWCIVIMNAGHHTGLW